MLKKEDYKLVDLHRTILCKAMQRDVGKTFRVLIEGVSKEMKTKCLEEPDTTK
jgi:hypothetical protein